MTESAACCLVHQLGKCDAVFTCCDRCPTFFADRAKPIYGKPFHGWSCDCDECKGYDERGEPRPGEAPRPQASAARRPGAPCPDCGHQPDTPNHYYGCRSGTAHRHLIGRHVHPNWHGHCDPAKRGYKPCDQPHWHFWWRHAHA